MKSHAFSAVVGVGHGSHYLLVPFEPQDLWPGLTKVKIPRPDDPRGGQGYLVSGTMNGREFTGHIGQRYGTTYMILSDALRAHVGVGAGDPVDVVVTPLSPPPLQKAAKKTAQKKTAKKKTSRETQAKKKAPR